ncbi:guanine deaminase [Glaciecola sp. 2405UD65-10]|uniref:guanine deaminase n=1 Tax=Glaciecola sp. 2405UD65-10 TaxID=3397244 RepID=UPI003B5BDAB7
MVNSLSLYRASILHFAQATDAPQNDAQYFADGALVVENERIVAIGDYAELAKQYANAHYVDYQKRLIIPGLIDSHLHYPQTEMIAKYGEQLLSWLENYTFPTENKFASVQYCELIAKHFIQQLIANGTTTACAYSTVHKHAADALFKEASLHNMAFIAGKVCMDRHCPSAIQDTPEQAQLDSHKLIETWHGKGRNLYALTPRFAPTSSAKQLSLLGELAQQYPDVFIQTHLSENQNEIEWVKSLYPQHCNYLDVYDHYNMVRPRALFGHCLHLYDEEWQRLSEAKATAVFCPTSNLFLGSGLFNIEKAKQENVSIALATDVGAGTSFNMLNTYGEAYKVGQLQGQALNALEGLYLMTQGPACAYSLNDQIGNLNPGTYADFVVLNPSFNRLGELRCASSFESQANGSSGDGEDILFALSFIGDDRAVEATYIAGTQRKHTLLEG